MQGSGTLPVGTLHILVRGYDDEDDVEEAPTEQMVSKLALEPFPLCQVSQLELHGSSLTLSLHEQGGYLLREVGKVIKLTTVLRLFKHERLLF